MCSVRKYFSIYIEKFELTMFGRVKYRVCSDCIDPTIDGTASYNITVDTASAEQLV